MTLTPLDPEYQIEVDPADSPLFANILQNWSGCTSTVTELEALYYEELIVHTRVEQHVFTIRHEPAPVIEHVGTQIHEQIVAVTRNDIPAVDEIDDTVTRLEKYHWDYDHRRRRWHRTRLFFSLVWAAFKEARAS